MRAREFISENITPSRPVTLRALHKIKYAERRHAQDDAERRILMPIMYGLDHPGDVESERRELDFERREIALDKREAELNLIQQQIEQSSEARDAIRKMAKHAIESNDT